MSQTRHHSVRGGGAKTTTTKKKRAGTGKARARGDLASASIAAIQAELQRRLATLQKKRDQVAAELDDLDREIAACATAGPNHVSKRSPPRTGGQRNGAARRPRNATNLATALRKLLARRTMSVTDMSEAVQAAGYRTSSPHFRTIVNQTLINNPEVFRRVSRGKYTAKT